MRHLSDELLQQYLDTPELTDRSFIEVHLNACFECQSKFEQYQELYRHLSIESEEIPDQLFTTNVLSAVGKIESRKRLLYLLKFSVVFASSVILMIALNYFGFFNWQGVLSALKDTSVTLLNPLFETVGLLVEKLNGNLEILAFAGFVLLLFQMLDRGLLKHKANRT